MSSFYSIVEKDASGNDVSFEKFRGKVLYGVNVASRCGYTNSGYALLNKAIKIDGVEVLVFPCNQFGAQEPGTDSDIGTFCANKGVTGPNVNQFTKGDVNGANTRPTYAYLREKGVIGNVSWNFAGKFIVDNEGNVKSVADENKLETELAQLVAK